MASVARPDAPSVVKAAVDGVEAPIVAPSTVPPLMSAVAATRDVLAVKLVNVPAAGVDTPMAVLSIAPELMSIVVNTRCTSRCDIARYITCKVASDVACNITRYVTCDVASNATRGSQ
jgi:hypothetical protein